MASPPWGGEPVWLYQTPFSLEPSSASDARAFVRRHLLSHDLSHCVDDVQLVVSELATNAILHAQTPFTVTLRCLGASVVLEVRDGSALLPSLISAQSLATSGRGVAIMQELSREWGVTTYAPGEKSVWATFWTGLA